MRFPAYRTDMVSVAYQHVSVRLQFGFDVTRVQWANQLIGTAVIITGMIWLP